MQRINILLFLLLVCFATAMQAQTPAPKPHPALKKLSALVGHWTYEGEYKAGPLGPGGKITGEYTGQMVLGGFFFEARWAEKGAMGVTRGLEIYGYDPANKNFTFSVYMDDGSRFSGVLTVSGNTFTWEGKDVVGGKEYLIRIPFICAADLMSGTQKAQISSDGKTWAPLFDEKWTKAKPAPKK